MLDKSIGRGHGREEVRLVQVVTVTVTVILFPHAAQVLRIVRKRRKLGAKTWDSETVYAITDPTAEQATAAELAGWARGHWTIETSAHWIRDITFGQDTSKARTRNAPAVLAALRDIVRSTLRKAGRANTASARHAHTNPEAAPTLHRTPRTNPDNPGTLPGRGRRVTVAAHGNQRLMVGFRAAITVTPAAQLFATRQPSVTVDVQRIESDDQATMVLDGSIDIAYVWLPLDEAGLRVALFYIEPRVAALPAGHRLAGKEHITEMDLAGEPLLWHADPSTQPTMRSHPNAGYLVRGVDETLEHVAAGRGISFLARSATVFYSHPYVSYVPVTDLAPDQVCLAVAASRTSPLVDDFLNAARETAEVTAECGNYEMWQLGGDAAAQHN